MTSSTRRPARALFATGSKDSDLVVQLDKEKEKQTDLTAQIHEASPEKDPPDPLPKTQKKPDEKTVEPEVLPTPLEARSQPDSENRLHSPKIGDRIMVLKEAWLALVLQKIKTMEVRGAPAEPGPIWLACAGSIYGSAKITSCTPLSAEEFQTARHQHRHLGDELPFANTFGLCLDDIQQLPNPMKHYRPPTQVPRATSEIGRAPYKDTMPAKSSRASGSRADNASAFKTLKNPVTWHMKELNDGTPVPKVWSQLRWGSWTDDAQAKWEGFVGFVAETKRDAQLSSVRIPNLRRSLAAAIKAYLVSLLRFGTTLAPTTVVKVELQGEKITVTVSQGCFEAKKGPMKRRKHAIKSEK
ncbi:unnamed protein product [Symbiodinium sp. CCMP2592]|nr:unnamed protein product [Symbiodinium sp. CCMP2592]